MLMMNPEVCGPASIFEICAEVGTFLVADERSRCRHEPQTRGTPFVNHRLHHCCYICAINSVVARGSDQ